MEISRGPQNEELRAAVKGLFRKKGEIFYAPKKERPSLVENKPKRSLTRERFLRSTEWLAVREVIFARDGAVCVKCGSEDKPNVDHIIPKSKVPALALDELNLRVLCWSCNKTKAARIEMDYVVA